jgi:hypothetical protein
MRDATPENTKRVEQTQPLQPIEDARFLERAGEPIVGEQARTPIDEVRKGADKALRVVNPTLSGDAATTGDVAVQQGRGVAGLAR